MELHKLIILIFIFTVLSVTATSSTDDQAALLNFKSLLSDPTGALSSWSNRTLNTCKWFGVICSSRYNPNRVTALHLDSLNLTGPISPSLSNLSFLIHLHLGENKLSGQIPGELGQLQKLRYLNISHNSLVGYIPKSLSRLSSLQNVSFSDNLLRGEIPSFLSNCSYLQVLCLDKNMLVGTVPDSFASLRELRKLFLNENQLTGQVPAWLGTVGSLSMLTSLDLSRNNLTGHIPASLGSLPSLLLLALNENRLEGGIPASLGNCSSLIAIHLSDNDLDGGIPESLARLPNLEEFDISFNHLSGTISSSFYNLSNLVFLNLGLNYFSGELPANIGHTLPNLQFLLIQGNQFEGPIPISLSNASGIEVLDLAMNNFSGIVPPNLGGLQNLRHLNLGWNQLVAKDVEGWSFLSSLTNCTQLSFLILCKNYFQGKLPNNVVNLSATLEEMLLFGNHISGSIPVDIKNLESLTRFDLHDNFLMGKIPGAIGSLSSLQVLDLSNNRLSGQIPVSLGNLSILSELQLGKNLLQGNIPTSFGNFKNLMLLNLSYNQLNGIIPTEVVSISSLSKVLDLSHNSLSGPMPLEIGRLQNLGWLDISYNKLSGKIPSTLGECDVLQYLYLEGNSLEGPIPSRLSNLKGIQEVDLSHNNLSGNVPDFLSKITSLKSLNLSFNHFEGRVPVEGVFRNLSAVSLSGNDQLCGGDPKLQLPTCVFEDSKAPEKKLPYPALIGIIIAIFIGICLCSSLICITCYKKQRPRQLFPFVTFSEDRYRQVSYAELCKATDDFSSDILIGTGGFGSVYRGRIAGYKRDVAIKVLKLQQRGAFKSFLAECEALRNIRHRNLAKILTSCSTIDAKGNDFKALVFEFMPNGSLEEWLHPNANEDCYVHGLSFAQRLNIAVDVACALEYLHHHSSTPIVHCDLKPSNVLLDDEMGARVTDFGLSRILDGDKCMPNEDPSLSVVVKGSIGYIAPEYGMFNQASTQGDVYSYGILLLELLTGKKPTDDIFNDNMTLHKFVESAFPERILEIADPRLFLLEKTNGGISLNGSAARESLQQYLLSMMTIGLWCARETPNARPQMRVVATELHAIRTAYIGIQVI